MRIQKYTHACVRLEKGDQALVIDPGTFSEAEPLDGATAVLITHEHPDHLDPAKLEKYPDLPIYTNEAVAEQLADFGTDRLNVVAEGSRFEIGAFQISVHGALHEVIHPDLPSVPNVGFFVDDSFFHPGDAFTVPDRPVRTLMVPVSAPWLRAADSVDYIRTVRPELALAVHDGLYNDIGLSIVDRLLGQMAEQAGSEYRRLAVGAAVDA
ncbi:MBL fold metallo-hydrolase [Tenggerimyces flavus]|uniref:MBL fold metallo-hydrolase n=1 Tax=Tenggerimyces flavus TaxID=1708749 RepID=A0ABV7Y5V6_9ACTN|nr:MBL fold metallo-hydrolase [Tenggerimyces flavus]MBM7791039.1 L-ascorbate metabolism protein UlaG (beta-lactamase superfamily) [Tenggerimyces flavus]